MPAPPPPRPFDVHPIAGLVAAGWDRNDVDREVRAGRARPVRRGVYALGVPPTTDLRRHGQQAAAALVRVRHDPVVSHTSAAVLWDVPTIERVTTVRLSVGRQVPHAHPGLAVHVAQLADADRTARHGLPVTSLGRTLVDVARTGGVAAGVVAADAVLHRSASDPPAFGDLVADWDRALEAAVGWPGVTDARTARTFADERAESPLESLTRWTAHDVGLPPMDLQRPVTGRGWSYRLDAVVLGEFVAIECDGRSKYRTEPLPGAPQAIEDRVWRDLQRDRRLHEIGWEVVRVTWDDVRSRPPVFRLRVLDAIERSRRRHRVPA